MGHSAGLMHVCTCVCVCVGGAAPFKSEAAFSLAHSLCAAAFRRQQGFNELEKCAIHHAAAVIAHFTNTCKWLSSDRFTNMTRIISCDLVQCLTAGLLRTCKVALSDAGHGGT